MVIVFVSLKVFPIFLLVPSLNKSCQSIISSKSSSIRMKSRHSFQAADLDGHLRTGTRVDQGRAWNFTLV